MKRNFVVGLFGGLTGPAMLLIVLSASGIAVARSVEVRADVSRVDAVSANTPLSSTFTYQGQLKNGGNAVNGPCQMAFRLYDDPAASTNLIGSPITTTVPVTDGLFTVGLNFGSNGNVFDGNGRWLDIQVNCGSGFTQLTPRQALTAAPYAFALPGLYTRPNAASPSVIGGYSGNFISSTVVGGVIGGGGVSGFPNSVRANYATIGGGNANIASGYAATIGGGSFITASGFAATVGGGYGNTASDGFATVGGGLDNTASGLRATVGGGYTNTASGWFATVAGGQNNAANGNNSMILGGSNNTVTGTNSMAGGLGALANGNGCFAWGDVSTGNTIACGAENVWTIRATGGFWFYPSPTEYCSLQDATGWHCGLSSDRNAKQDFVSVNPRQVLNQVVALPIEKWAYKDDTAQIQHIGPMAQDFYAAFNVGTDDRHINPVDSEGVALAAIQGLNQVVQDKNTQIAVLQQQNADLAARVSKLEQNSTASNPPSQAEPFNVSTLLSVIALISVGGMWLQQRRSKRGQA